METLLVGRRIWVTHEFDNGVPVKYDCKVTGVKKFLPAGPVAVSEPSSYDSIRTTDLIQLYTDPGGVRTLAVASIHLNDPGRRKK